MVNKKIFIKIFIVFFIINIFYFITNQSKAVTLNVSESQTTIGEGSFTNITVYLYDKSIFDPSAGDKLQFTLLDPGGNEQKGDVGVSIGPPQIGTNSIRWEVSFKGKTKGKIKVMFSIGNEFSPSVTVTVNDKNSTGTSSTNVTINTNILREDLGNEFDPNNPIGGYNVSQPVINVIIPVVSKILAILQIIGAILLVISLAIAGFNGILGAGDGFSEDLGLSVGTSTNQYGIDVKGVQNLTKGSLSKILRRAFIGIAILESSITIVRIVFSVVTNI